MSQKKNNFNVFFAIMAIILGSKLYKHTDFQNLRFEKPLIDSIYLITFIGCLFFVVKGLLNRNKKEENQ